MVVSSFAPKLRVVAVVLEVISFGFEVSGSLGVSLNGDSAAGAKADLLTAKADCPLDPKADLLAPKVNPEVEAGAAGVPGEVKLGVFE